ncbi:MAG: DUF4252 domain-containing protein [Gammaproteobacteria bacterium]|nr:DUF4252 domain-containing protein [Gammaproteobacteria bacterium]MXZ31875.1 DUF4252 domain-containing protein [Gammaproteobacteria bacterium]MYA67644.1 DUF4252 domain-containing protein [Gammaproteobacteria bacterium]MYE98773.1 DUF4252 domain-containing protein [Gammaproteobacteria bacterium]MYG97433.1 DUF4252 domain-containing protein [Gammaproteobacteria bacterium]
MQTAKQTTPQVIAACALTVFANWAAAAENHPGYVDFADLRGLVDAEPVVEVTLREPLLRLVTEAIPEEDVEAAGFVSRLLNVRLHVYEDIVGDVTEVATTMNELSAGLEEDGWERVVRVRDDDDQVDIFLNFSEDDAEVYGIALMVVSEDGEVVLGNIVGNIRMEDISALGRRFDIEELAEFHEEMEEEDRR